MPSSPAAAATTDAAQSLVISAAATAARKSRRARPSVRRARSSAAVSAAAASTAVSLSPARGQAGHGHQAIEDGRAAGRRRVGLGVALDGCGQPADGGQLGDRSLRQQPVRQPGAVVGGFGEFDGDRPPVGATHDWRGRGR